MAVERRRLLRRPGWRPRALAAGPKRDAEDRLDGHSPSSNGDSSGGRTLDPEDAPPDVLSVEQSGATNGALHRLEQFHPRPTRSRPYRRFKRNKEERIQKRGEEQKKVPRARKTPSKTAGGAPTKSKGDHRRRVQRRRARLVPLGAVIISALVLLAWFPFGALVQQRHELSSDSATLRQLTRQDRALSQEQKRLGQPGEAQRIARQQYQMILPGEQAYEVLPKNAHGSSTAAPYSGDPALQPLVAPSASTELYQGSNQPAGSGAVNQGSPSNTQASAETGARKSASGLWQRMLETLEFWK